MNRSLDKLRMIGGLFLLSNVLAVFLPVLFIRQENYPEQVYSQFSFIMGYLMPGTGADALSASGGACFLAILLILVPLLLSVFACVCSFIGKLNRGYTVLGGLAAGVLYLCQLLFSRSFWPDRLNDAQEYVRGIGWWFVLLSACAVLIIEGISLWIILHQAEEVSPESKDFSHLQTDKRVPSERTERQYDRRLVVSPVAGEQRQEDSVTDTQTDAMKYPGNTAENPTLSQTRTEINLTLETMATMEPKGEKADTVLPPRGVMVGVSGVYAGKEISFRDKETLHLGRDLSNDLVFTNASHVSRNHCLITWYAQKQKFYVEDRSSNGCYINGAPVRLPQNVEIALDPGTTIDIGDRSNRFRLE